MVLVGNERFVFAFACHRITPNIRNAFHTKYSPLYQHFTLAVITRLSAHSYHISVALTH